MKKITAYFDCQFGAAGDMLLGALISAGLDFDQWCAEVKKLALPWDKIDISLHDVMRCTIAAKKVQIDVTGDSGKPVDEHSHHHQVHDHDHPHDHDHHHHHHDHDHDHSHYHEDHFAHENEHGTTLSQIMEILDASSISPYALELSKKILLNLADAEGKVHGISPWKARFHEVGTLDAIVDIAGFAIGYEMLGIESAHVSAIPLGRGEVKTGHGIFPIPCPAVANIMCQAGAPVSAFDIPFECLTPTGAAILTTIATVWTKMPAFESISSCGHGAGNMNPKNHPNIVRLLLGNVEANESESRSDLDLDKEIVCVVEANIDDCPPSWLAFTSEQSLKEGALDVTITPCVMKKGRSAHQLSVLVKISDKEKVEKLLLSETTTIGVRSYLVERNVSRREFQTVKLAGESEIRIKIARDNEGKILNVQPEYSDCAEYSLKNGKPLKEVFALAMSTFAAANDS